jgi:hypothetical protein
VQLSQPEPKPDFSIKTKALEASVLLDAKIKPIRRWRRTAWPRARVGEKNRADADKERRAGARLVPQRVVV